MVGLVLIPYLAWRIFKRGDKEHLIPVIWASAVLGLFSPMRTKLHWYVMTIYPAIALMTGWAVAKVFRKYAVPAVTVLAAASLVYLAFDKGIFNLDYSPEIKKTAQAVHRAISAGEKVYLYDIGDPGMQFYMGDVGENVRGEEDLKSLLNRKGVTLLTVRGKAGAMNTIPGPARSVILESGDFILLRT
jgi:hypothetical protein